MHHNNKHDSSSKHTILNNAYKKVATAQDYSMRCWHVFMVRGRYPPPQVEPQNNAKLTENHIFTISNNRSQFQTASSVRYHHKDNRPSNNATKNQILNITYTLNTHSLLPQ